LALEWVNVLVLSGICPGLLLCLGLCRGRLRPQGFGTGRGDKNKAATNQDKEKISTVKHH
jgi:hypothetical protein